MNKKVAKRVACFAAASLIVFSGTSVIAADGNVNVTELTQNFPAAGLSLGFGNMTAVAENTVKAEADKDTDKTKDNADKIEGNTVTAGVSADVREVVLTSKKAKDDSEFADIAIAQVNDYVNIRSLPSEEGEVVGKLYNNSAATVLEEEGDWYKIKSGNVEGFVKAEFVVRDNPELAEEVRTRIAEVKTETLRVRKEASTDAPIMDLIPEGDTLIVEDETIEGWVGVVVGEKVGYVSTEFVEISSKYVQAESVEEEKARLKAEEKAKKKAAEDAKAAQAKAAAQSAANNKKQSSDKQSSDKQSSEKNSSSGSTGGGSGSAVASYALQFVGNPYVYGGSSLTSGTDCSGFVMSVYSAFGVGLPHQSGAQRGCGYGVSVGEAQPGDIMCYSGHVGIYIGNGQMVHASDANTGIIVSSIGNPIAVRRILG